MKQQKYIVYLFLFILLTIFLNFFYLGIINRAAYSNDYNVPIARSYLNGTLFTVNSVNPYMYFPGSSHVLLVPFVYTGFPNLYGLLGWLLLFLICIKLANTFRVNPLMSIIFASGFTTTISVIRTIADQSIDKWLCIWFLLSLILLEKVQRTWKYSIVLGLSLGMLIGTKYSGPLFFIALLLVYGKRLVIHFNPMRFSFSFLIFIVTGLFWYIRNFIVKSNPYYPANLLFFKGYPHFAQQDWYLWKVLVFYPKGIPDLVNSFLSEYLVWAFSGFVILWFLYSRFRKKTPIDSKILRLSLLGLTTGVACLFLPITTPYKIPIFHTISDMRYIYIFIAVLMLAVFLIVDHCKKNNVLAGITLLNALPVFSFIPYQPKIIIVCMAIFMIFTFKMPVFLRKYIYHS